MLKKDEKVIERISKMADEFKNRKKAADKINESHDNTVEAFKNLMNLIMSEIDIAEMDGNREMIMELLVIRDRVQHYYEVK